MQQPATLSPTAPARATAPAGHWVTGPRFALLLGLLIAATYPQVLLGLQTFVVRDFGFFAYPLAHFQRECFWHGQLPFWNQYNNCGVPFLAQWNSMPLYPPALIYLLLPLSWGLGLFCLLHLFFAGLGMYRLALRWVTNPAAAAVAGVAFAFNGLTLNLLMWPSHIATLAWMPWVIAETQAAWHQGGRRLPRAALAGALQMLAGGPETILLTWLFLTALWIGETTRAWKSSSSAAGAAPRRFPPMAWRFPVIVLLVAGLAAVQLLPFLDLAAHSQRETGYADARWSLPGRGWANFFVPMAFGRIWNMGVFFQHDQAWTSSYYLSLETLLLATLALLLNGNRRVWFLALAGALALALAFGDHSWVYHGLKRVLPQISLITYPVKFVILLVFIVPLLAAYGVAAFNNAQRSALYKRIFAVTAVFMVVIAVILFWSSRDPFPGDDARGTIWNGLIRALLLLVTAGVALLWAGRLTRWAAALPVAWLLIGWLDVFTHMPPQNPTVDPWLYTPGLARTQLPMQPQPALGASRIMVHPIAEIGLTGFTMRNPGTNYLIKRLAYFADCNLLDNVPKVNGFFSLYPRECGELTSIIYGSTNVAFPALADFMGVSHITANERFFDWVPRPGFMPLISAGQQPIYLEQAKALQAILDQDFKPRETVVLPPTAKAFITVTNRTDARITSTRFAHASVEFTVEATEPSLVTISQTWYHRWHALLDGSPVHLSRANYAFQALQVPPGSHTVKLIYREDTFYVGLVLSGAALVGCLLFWRRVRAVVSYEL